MKYAVTLLAFTPNPEDLICVAARRCRSNLPTLDIDTSNPEKVIRQIIEAGHLSVLEHVNFTFAIDGISRVCLSQLTRHRLASFTVQSQRFSEVDDLVEPRGLFSDEDVKTTFGKYKSALDSGVEKEDARYYLPQAVKTSLVLTMNARELLHFFMLRCCLKAQWEIRRLADDMLKLIKPVAPNIFKHAGAFCQQNGYCRESAPCGKMDVPHKHFLFELYRFWLENRR